VGYIFLPKGDVPGILSRNWHLVLLLLPCLRENGVLLQNEITVARPLVQVYSTISNCPVAEGAKIKKKLISKTVCKFSAVVNL
jgi:hypothetical protein